MPNWQPVGFKRGALGERHNVQAIERHQRSAGARNLHFQVELGLALLGEHLQKVLSRFRCHRLTMGKDLWRVDGLMIPDRAPPNHDRARPVAILEQKIDGSPPGDCANGIQAAGKRSSLVVPN